MEEFVERRRGMLTTGEWCIMQQPSQQHVVPCVNGVEWGLSAIGLGMFTAFWAGIPGEVTQEASVVLRL